MDYIRQPLIEKSVRVSEIVMVEEGGGGGGGGRGFSGGGLGGLAAGRVDVETTRMANPVPPLVVFLKIL